jgi:CO/xanthine dehydrogenase FAD-binding subunit
VKPSPFAYEAPTSLDGALSLLGPDATALAGGQSLVPLMNFRLARPARLVDLNRVPELAFVRGDGGALRIGAMTRQGTLERSEEVRRHWPLLLQALRCVGHPAIRARGTLGGSVAHADPRAELPVALTALDARFAACSLARGVRWLSAGELFVAPFTTALRDDELLLAVELTAPPAGARSAFVEHARAQGEFAVAGVAARVVPGAQAAIALLGAGPVPVREAAVEEAVLAGATPAQAAARAAGSVRDDYRRALLRELVRRALSEL